MSQGVRERPDVSEYAPYYGRYISLVTEEHVVEVLEHQLARTLDFFRACAEQDGDRRYAPGKWTVREVIGHVIDTERVMAFRALSFARSDPATLPGMEQDDWARFSSYGALPLSELMEEFSAVRQSTLALLRHLSPEAWSRRGIASGCEFTVKALAYIIAGHERHHMDILKTRYFAES
ncbi:MAG TPA: DinB family protein [Bacteroidota bacterium]|nr:DinB family protein [Bacteroidota bacterium]